MSKAFQTKLEEANKLIFVKRYDDAEELIDALLVSEAGRRELLVHIRAMELASLLGKLESVRAHYLNLLKEGSDPEVHELCVALVEQLANLVSPAESTTIFTEHMRRFGPSAAAHYGIAVSMERQGNHERAIFNYQQALNLDPGFCPACFGLSQIYYQMGDDKRGDHFFYMFEQAAPYNVYGNFETHRRLCQDFLARERFAEAEAAIQTLAEWWLENKGHCPAEIQVYEQMASARIAEARGDQEQARTRRDRASALARLMLEDQRTSEGVLFFIAKVLEEFDQSGSAKAYYRRILTASPVSAGIVQKIGSQFLATGDFATARELFEEAYAIHPEHSDVRFCRLVANLKLASVNVEEYLIGRERLRQLVDGGGDRVELLALLHSLMAKFAGDADVQGHVADVYLRLGNIDRAGRHYDQMYIVDGLSRQTALKYASFLMQYRDPEQAMAILGKIMHHDKLPSAAQAEVYWLKATYHARRGEFRESQPLLRRVLALDPWNVSYLVQEIHNLAQLAAIDPDTIKADKILSSLGNVDESKLDWGEFDRATTQLEAQHAYELVYARQKLRYLYADGSEAALASLVRAACKHDASRATFDLIKLLNTNFDSPLIYWALGTVYKELWQLETAVIWFEQMLLDPSAQKAHEAKAYVELADCLAWQGRQEQKAVEYAKLALDLDEGKDMRAVRVMGHACLKAGQIREARLYIDQTDAEQDPEARYLQGLLQYRNGAMERAKAIWKTLLTTRSNNRRLHAIKQEVLKFYFDGAPYLKAN